jgi:hypothetical protein
VVTASFELVDRRLTHADNQINALERAYRGFLPKLNDHRIVVKPNAISGTQEAQIRFSWSVPDSWGLMVGEVMHHLRSILDNTIWQLVLANDRVPNQFTEYPIARDSEWFTSRAPKKLRGVSAEVYTIIEKLQPHCRADVDYRKHPLWLIHELDIIDKHQIVHVAAVVPASGGWTNDQAHVDAGMSVRHWYRPLENGTTIMEFMFERPCDVPVKVDSKVALAVKILETERTPYLDFPDFLHIAHRTTSQVVNRLRPALESGH